MTLLNEFLKLDSLTHFVRKIEEMNKLVIATMVAIKISTFAYIFPNHVRFPA
jgi:hypothetical protein